MDALHPDEIILSDNNFTSLLREANARDGMPITMAGPHVLALYAQEKRQLASGQIHETIPAPIGRVMPYPERT